MEIGIIGLPNVGKTSLFNLLTGASAQIGDFPFTTIEPNVGVVAARDPRLEKLGSIFHPEKLTPAPVRFVDVAGLVKGAHAGEGLGNKFLSHIRPLEALMHVVRDFVSPAAGGPDMSAGQAREIVETELLLADMEYARRAREKIIAAARSGDKSAVENLTFLDRALSRLDSGAPLGGDFSRAGTGPCALYDFLTTKPVFCVINTTAPLAVPPAADTVAVDVKLETEALALPPGERAQLLAEYGIKEDAVSKIFGKALEALDLVAFYTVVGKEVRAWNIKNGSSAIEAAAKIHTDMAKGFVKAEVYSFDAIAAAGNEKKLHESGLVRHEGKDYAVKDGDILKIHFR